MCFSFLERLIARFVPALCGRKTKYCNACYSICDDHQSNGRPLILLYPNTKKRKQNGFTIWDKECDVLNIASPNMLSLEHSYSAGGQIEFILHSIKDMVRVLECVCVSNKICLQKTRIKRFCMETCLMCGLQVTWGMFLFWHKQRVYA